MLYFILFVACLIISLGGGIVGTILLFIKRKVKKNVALFPAGAALPLDDLNQYFSSVKHDANANTIVFQQASSFKRCVVAVVYSVNGKKAFKRFAMHFSDTQKACAIKLNGLNIGEYNVFVESVDGKINKHPSFDNSILFAIILGVAVAVFYAIAIITFVMYDLVYMDAYLSMQYRYYQATDIMKYWPGYNMNYAFALLGLIFPALGIGGFVLFDSLSKK